MEIKKIKYLEKDWYEVMIEHNVLKVPADLILKYNLLTIKKITKHKFNNLQTDLLYYDELNKTFKFIAKKFRSRQEVEKFTNDFHYQKQVIDYLIKNNYINDTAFAQAFINDKLNFTKKGYWKIKEELLLHGIDEEIVNKELEKIATVKFDEKLKKIVSSQIKKNEKYPRLLLWQKVLSYCLNLGYEREKINEMFNQYYFFDIKIIAKEKNKLMRKHKDLEKIKTLLYQKGFSNEEIKKVIK